ncbi:MAG: hybrid sensor histidine kinase/response regulator [Cyanosarcina radialis HA8281-LM2]|nr:hybrid sensor histidine kinase/response regulator [Cyanosarcina radialis HA8281-LM2]
MGADASPDSPVEENEETAAIDLFPDDRAAIDSLFPDPVFEETKVNTDDLLFPDFDLAALQTAAEAPDLFSNGNGNGHSQDLFAPAVALAELDFSNSDDPVPTANGKIEAMPELTLPLTDLTPFDKLTATPNPSPARRGETEEGSEVPPFPRREGGPGGLGLTPPAQPSEPSSVNSYQIDTIRVEPQKLDALMTQAGELTVTQVRMAHQMVAIEEIVALWEEWSRDSSTHRVGFDRLEKAQGDLKQFQNFHHRAEQRLEKLGHLIDRLKDRAYEDTARLEIVANELETGIRNLRLLPLSTIFNLFPRMVRDLAKQQGKDINFVIEGGDTRVDKRILEEIKDPLLHILRNAIDHGIETPQERSAMGKTGTATLRLRGYQTGSTIGIEVIEDGRGLNLEAIKQTALRRGVCREEELAAMTASQIQSLIFAPGFSTRTTITEISGRGVGLDVVRTNVERLKGTIQVESNFGMGCEFKIKLHATVATSQVLTVEVNSTSYAVPVEFVETTMLVSREEIFAIEGSQTIAIDGQPVSVAWLSDLLALPVSAPATSKLGNLTAKNIPCLILKSGSDRLGLLVDALLDRQDVVLKPQSKLLKRIRNVSGATILGNGEVCMVLNPQDLLKSIRKGSGAVGTKTVVRQTKTKQSLLLVEDSLVIRTQFKRLLENAGYEVTAAVDGLDGFNKLKNGVYDAVISDVEMPNLSGLELTAKIRQHQEYKELPIVLVTTLASDEDKRRGADAGANAYLTKGAFDQKLLLDTLRRLA